MEYQYELKIPKERVAVLIGIGGSIKKKIEQETNSKLDIDSQEGDVFVMGTDAMGLLTAREIVKAIGRGFNPDFAFLLLKPEYVLELISIRDFAGKSKNDEIRLKGRVIGEAGKSRRTIEGLTGAYISVYGKTIAILGESERVSMAKRAIDSLLSGSPHSTVYSWLEKRKKEVERREMLDSFGVRKIE